MRPQVAEERKVNPGRLQFTLVPKSQTNEAFPPPPNKQNPKINSEIHAHASRKATLKSNKEPESLTPVKNTKLHRHGDFT